MTPVPIRPAATLILIRSFAGGPRVLMGQRGAAAAFMPGKFVFPGGAVDKGDGGVALAAPLPAICAERLALTPGPQPVPAASIAVAAIRELWEETGLVLGAPAHWPDAPAGWESFAATGHRPAATGLRFIFRAITPPGGARRFDARFFLADAADLCSDPDDFGRASDELSHLQWVPLAQTRSFDLPFITEIVLAEVAALTDWQASPPSVPFFDNSADRPEFRRL